MNTTIVDNKAARYGSVITADASQGIPDRIEVMRAGSWPPENNKGVALKITTADLNQFVENFKAGIGVPGGKSFGQIPIDFSHNDDKEAAGWITNLSVENDILYADVTWTAAGKQALEGGMYKCFSPSFWPACLGEYPDPENHNVTAKNVLVGGGLTNIPFFKDLTAIMASNTGNRTDDNNKARKDNTVPTLDEVRIKDVASLTADDKKVLADGKSELSAAELTKFASVLEADTKDEKDKDVIDPELQSIAASIKSGTHVVMDASQVKAMTDKIGRLEASQKATEEKEAKEFVVAAVNRGAIKADATDKWVARIMADATIKADIEALPSNKVLAGEVGSGEDVAGKTANQELKDRAQELVKADTTLNMQDAIKRVMASDSDLVTRLKDERN